MQAQQWARHPAGRWRGHLGPDGGPLRPQTGASTRQQCSLHMSCDLSGHSCSDRVLCSSPCGLHTCCCGAASTLFSLTRCHCQQPRHRACLLDAAEQLPDAKGLCTACQPLSHPACYLQVTSLAFVWISHKHADHVLGLLGIVTARPASCPPLLVSLSTGV